MQAATLSAELAARGFPAELAAYLSGVGVNSTAAFSLIGGDAWFVHRNSSRGRRLAEHLKQSARQPRHGLKTPSVVVYDDVSGVFTPGVSKRVLSHSGRAIFERSDPAFRVFSTAYDQQALMAVFYDSLISPLFAARAHAVKQPPPSQSPSQPPSQEQSLPPPHADLYFAPLAVRLPPLHPYDSGDTLVATERVRAANASSDVECEAFGDLGNMEENHICMEAHRKDACETLARELAGTDRRFSSLPAALARRSFVLTTTGAASGLFCPMSEEMHVHGYRTEMRLAWDEISMSNQGSFVVQVPCISSIRWSSVLDEYGLTPPWQRSLLPPDLRPRRDLLISFVGSPNTPMKVHLIRWCRSVGPSVCGMIEANNGQFPQISGHIEPLSRTLDLNEGDRMMLSTLRLRSRSIFCLEPEGLNPGRKSQIDAILSGCIPVLVFPRRTYDAFLAYHFRWREYASVHIEPEEVLQGKVNLLEKLTSINASGAARSMQRAIAHHARSLVYGLDGAMRGDAVDTLVKTLADALNQLPGSRRCSDTLQHWRCHEQAAAEAAEGQHPKR
jgi:hypothetical protein